ncbi:TauD/TfdA family dioxygenase [Streptomyces cinnabarinus]|uniref:TauD/TfdA family dioxygenase n=1 Tax=Streptomyces cinnabarinus TaxID=67287 RepID=A0ABY7K740_9ACTN|nr:TauD/TfdA family dioxygenase [Streptomyces cinnabarinus]WAZ19958.1 TauD/TfdA family dioxygenase [Streptomyces cinnabarinus]
MTPHWLEEPGAPVTAVVDGLPDAVAAADWIDTHRDALRGVLTRHGALYLRGLPVSDAADFALVRDALFAERAKYQEKATPRSDFGDDVFSSTDLPPAQAIRMHNENSYTLTFPGLLLFGCLTAPTEGGATPVADVRRVLDRLPADLVDRFRRHGWSLVRNYAEHISLDWRTAFATDSRADVERYCAANAIDVTWGDDDTLRTRQVRSATVRHPRTGEEVWFNHVAFWSEWALDPDIRDVLVGEFGGDGLPFNTAFGDGTPLTPEDVAVLDAAYEHATVRRAWQPGDLLLVDNVRTAHGRDPFRGDRKIVVAMGEPVALADCTPSLPVPAPALAGRA